MTSLRSTVQPLALLTFLVISQAVIAVENANLWTRFRGPNGLGTIPRFEVPLPWKAEQVIGRVDLPGFGNGSPVIWNNTAFLLAGDRTNADRQLIAIDIEKPHILWQKKFASTVHHIHKLSSYASSTPCVDEKHVYCVWGAPTSVTVKAFTHAGEEVWSRDLGRYVTQHGFGTSPVVVGDHLIFLNSQDVQDVPEGVEPGTESMIALNRFTGATAWETPLNATRVCYGSPSVTKINGRDAVVCSSTGNGFFAMDALTGEKLWKPKPSVFGKRVVSSILQAGPLLISTEGSGGGGHILFAVKADGSQEEVYRITRSAPYVPTPVAYRDMLFLWADNGIVSCVDTNTGDVHWTERIGGNVSTSPVVLGDKLIGITQDGLVTILAADKKFQNLGEVALEQAVKSTPAATANRLLIRSDEQLWVIAP